MCVSENRFFVCSRDRRTEHEVLPRRVVNRLGGPNFLLIMFNIGKPENQDLSPI